MMERMIPPVRDFHGAATLLQLLPVQYQREKKDPWFQKHPHPAFFLLGGCYLASLGATTCSSPPVSVPDALTAVFSFPRGEAETGCHDMSLGRGVREAWVGGAAPPCPKPASATPAITDIMTSFIMRGLGGIGIRGSRLLSHFFLLDVYFCFHLPMGEDS